ncbi:Cationic amino acid transporter 4 [Cichlidogyrus casuarinus]|uniref:Cationic amino acid transporter 4 n=1 Tax=Cichlidogyrus casuarinus TaxID=1844966 RepID=A0ABD2PRP7_9PLAT
MFMERFSSKSKELWRGMRRSKPLTSSNMDTPLKRCLTVFDLTLLGIGNMAGSGIYVLTGTVIRDKAGPSTFLSYMIAGITAFLNAICYSELASRIPKAGSAYIYTYIASGEFLAFLIGWSVILEYVLSVASVARGWSGILDTMTNGTIKNGTIATFGRFPAHTEFFGEYPDFIGFLVVLFLGVVLSRGPKLSAHLNSAVTMCNLMVIVLTSGTMLSHVTQTGSKFAPASKGGFFPHGFAGMIGGAGTCFYAFIGFDAITISCEEALDPKRSIPIASAVSVGLVMTLFIISSAALVLFVPWWEVDRTAAYTAAFTAKGITWARYVTGIGSVLGLSASLFTSMYAMPRIVYSMAADGLLPSWLGYVMPSTQVR